MYKNKLQRESYRKNIPEALIINIKTNSSGKSVEIWVEGSEKSSYKANEEYIGVVSKYKALGYKISVFIGGDKALLPTITALLEAQIIKAK